MFHFFFLSLFDVRLYECVGAFDWVGWDVLDRLKDHGVIYLYGAMHVTWLVQLTATCACHIL